MSDEYDNSNEAPSVFWPILIILIGFVVWFGYNDFAINAQRSLSKQQLEAATPVFNAAQNWQGRYNALMKDLIDTAPKSPNAKAILNGAVQLGVQSGLIRFQQPPGGTNGTANPAGPAASSSSTPTK